MIPLIPFIIGGLAGFGIAKLATDDTQKQPEKKSPQPIKKITWKQYVNDVINHEGIDSVAGGHITDFKEDEMNGAPERFYPAFKRLTKSHGALSAYVDSNNLYDEDEEVYVKDVVDKEGLDYGLIDYGYTWAGVDDKKFHNLLDSYEASRKEFMKIIKPKSGK